MATVEFVQKDGTTVVGTAECGSLMELARACGVRGIEGQCGGVMSCGTCHVRVSPEWRDRIGAASPDEVDLLEFEDGFSEASKLSCQIPISNEVDGLVVHVVGE